MRSEKRQGWLRMLNSKLKHLQTLFRYTCLGFAILFASLLLPSLNFSLFVSALILIGFIIIALIAARCVLSEW